MLICDLPGSFDQMTLVGLKLNKKGLKFIHFLPAAQQTRDIEPELSQ